MTPTQMTPTGRYPMTAQRQAQWARAMDKADQMAYKNIGIVKTTHDAATGTTDTYVASASGQTCHIVKHNATGYHCDCRATDACWHIAAILLPTNTNTITADILSTDYLTANTKPQAKTSHANAAVAAVQARIASHDVPAQPAIIVAEPVALCPSCRVPLTWFSGDDVTNDQCVLLGWYDYEQCLDCERQYRCKWIPYVAPAVREAVTLSVQMAADDARRDAMVMVRPAVARSMWR